MGAGRRCLGFASNKNKVNVKYGMLLMEQLHDLCSPCSIVTITNLRCL
jgi:hypothetical protein